MAQPAHNNTATVAHGPSAGEVAFPPFDTSTYPGQLVWLALTFGVLFYVMSKVIVPRLSGMIETRRQTIATDLDQAAAMRARAEEAGAAYEKSLNEARAKAQAIALDTRAALSSETDSKRKALEAELSEKLAASDAQIRARTQDAMANVHAIAVDAARDIVEHLTGRAPAPDAMAKAVGQTS
jgi:F-type H+-transporting ATPase subunit b